MFFPVDAVEAGACEAQVRPQQIQHTATTRKRKPNSAAPRPMDRGELADGPTQGMLPHPCHIKRDFTLYGEVAGALAMARETLNMKRNLVLRPTVAPRADHGAYRSTGGRA
jgi:hypothetical protein